MRNLNNKFQPIPLSNVVKTSTVSQLVKYQCTVFYHKVDVLNNSPNIADVVAAKTFQMPEIRCYRFMEINPVQSLRTQ